MSDILIDRVMIECPLCDKCHLVEKRTRTTCASIKGEIVDYSETYYTCTESEKIESFVPAKLMDENLLAARNAYRVAHGLMTSHEIVQLRKKFNLSQKELALLLGWGEITVTRYETKQIQNETHDNILKSIQDNALEARKLLERNKDNFECARCAEIFRTIDDEIERTSVSYLIQQKIQARQIRYQDNLEATGGTVLNVNKVRNMMLFFANKCKNLFKVKLMKLLWFSDALNFQRNNVSMSGLVYQHMPMGALPIVHKDLMDLVSVETIVDDALQKESYKILPGTDFDEAVFSDEEIAVLYEVLYKFNSYSGTEIAEYMHEEVAYIQTCDRGIIPYSLAKRIRPF